MRQLFVPLGAFVFLIALAINCVQAAQIAFDPVLSPVTALSASQSSETTGSEFAVAEDESDSYLCLSQARCVPVLAYKPEPVFARVRYLPLFLFSSHTVLTL